MARLAPLIALVGLACSPADPPQETGSAEAASSLDASAGDIAVMPSSIEVCIDGRDKPRGRFLVKNPTDQRFRVAFEPKGALLPVTLDIEPLALETVVFEPLRESGTIAFRNETLAGAQRAVKFVETADVRVLSVRAEGNAITVSNPIAFRIMFAARIEGPGDFGADNYSSAPLGLQPDETTSVRVRRIGVGPVRVTIVGPRCAGFEIPELPVIEIP
jgi:hypothetical protein